MAISGTNREQRKCHFSCGYCGYGHFARAGDRLFIRGPGVINWMGISWWHRLGTDSCSTNNRSVFLRHRMQSCVDRWRAFAWRCWQNYSGSRGRKTATKLRETIETVFNQVLVNLDVNFADDLAPDGIEETIDRLEYRIKAALPVVNLIYIQTENLRRTSRIKLEDGPDNFRR